MLISCLIGTGAGLIVPFFNVYFNKTLQAGPDQIGIIFSLAQASMVVGAAVVPYIAARFGKVKTVSLTYLLSLPFLLLLAFTTNLYLAGGAYILRMLFMNMSSPGEQQLLHGDRAPGRDGVGVQPDLDGQLFCPCRRVVHRRRAHDLGRADDALPGCLRILHYRVRPLLPVLPGPRDMPWHRPESSRLSRSRPQPDVMFSIHPGVSSMERFSIASLLSTRDWPSSNRA